MDEKNVALSPTEVLEGVILTIEKRYSCKRIALENKVFSEISDDSDGHRTRKGHMIYEDFILLTSVGKRSWGIAIGTKDNCYPGEDLYRNDIVAVPVEKELDVESQKILFSSQVERGEYFRNSLLIATVPGYLAATANSVFGTLADKNLGGMLHNEPVANKQFITLGGNAIFDKAATYRPETIDLVVENIILILGKR